MSRNLTIIALVGLLAACSAQGDGQASDASIEAEPSAIASASATASEGASEGTVGTSSAACTDAFAPLAEQDVTSLSSLSDLEGVEATIQGCESIADWIAGAQEIIGEEVNPSTAQLLLDIRCELPSLSDTAVCEEIASS